MVPIIVFDVADPLAVYYGGRAAGLSNVSPLVLSGVLPAINVTAGFVRRRRLDVLGAVVLGGIALGTIVGLASGSARLYLLDGIVPMVVLGAACLISLRFERPLMFGVALESMGEDSPRGRSFAGMWRYPGFRHTFKVMTVVWGLVFLSESALQALIVETTSINAAKMTSNLLPIAVAAVTIVWTRAYGQRARRRGQRLAAQASGVEVGSLRGDVEADRARFTPRSRRRSRFPSGLRDPRSPEFAVSGQVG